MISTARLVQTLGGKGVFRERQATYGAIIEKARTGLPYAALEAIATRFAIPQETLVRALHLPPRTLARRKKARRLSADESDRLLRLARVAAQAEDVLGSQERAGAWLRGSVRALGRVRPLDLLDTDLGAQQVERILGRIEHGVYS
jgi:putative toxin-antitoxin system antitoxin component (TIGR02293 family)